MALEPAGVDLQAKGFKQYIANLEAIEKQQREVFDREFKGTERSFEKTQKAARDYQRELDKTAKQEKRLAAEQKKRQQIQRALIAAGVALVAREALQFAKESVELAQIQAKAEAQLATAIQSTGGAAGLSSRELKDLASSLQSVTNFGDEATIQAEALLLTFKEIGSDVFPDAIKAILDTATAMDQGLQPTTIQIGKALNEPIEGLSALRRVGIQFTDAQEDLIRSFVEAGDKASAQRIILQELNSQFGGSAEAAREADGGVVALGNSFGDFQEQVGFLIKDLNELFGVTEGLIGVFDSLGAGLRGLRSDLGFGDTADAIAGAEVELRSLQKARDDLASGPRGFAGGGSLLSQLLQTVGIVDEEAGLERLDQAIAEAQANLDELKLQAAAEDAEELAQAAENASTSVDDLTDSVADQETQIKAFENAVRQAEQIQLSFARAAEDSARRLGRQQAKLAQDQLKDRLDLLDDQAKEFDQFNQDELKSVQDAEEELAEARQKAGKERIRDQDKLFRELRQARDRFNLDNIQSERRFQLQDRRLRASGDILALQELREDFALQQQEAQENFGLQQSQRKEDAKSQEQIANEQRQEQIKQLEQQVADLQGGLEQRRTEFLAAQEEELNALLAAQAEQRQSLQQSYLEQQEDARINQQRQLEDLGRSLATQEGITAEGVMAIAGEIEGVFGQEGVADTIFAGFTARTESEFQTLFANIEELINESSEELKKIEEEIRLPVIFRGGGSRDTLGGLGASSGVPSFADGGIVPGPRGSPQLIQAHGGETVLPTHRMNAPVIPSQTLNVQMGGGFDIRGGEAAGQAVVQAAIGEMVEMVETVVKRLERRI